MKRKILVLLLAVITPLAALFASGGAESKKPLTWIWYPNESAPEYAEARAEVIRVVSTAIGREIKDQTTTDYAIAIEALANNNAAFSWFGGEGYIQAHAKNAKVLPLVTNSSSATLETAKYYSMIGVLKENGPQYMVGGKYSLETLKQKKFSFVSNSSTSGFRVPSSVMARQFKVQAADLLEGGPGKVFAEVMFGGSHQGSFFNVLSGKADVGAFCNECIRIYVDWSQARYEDPVPGDVIKVLPTADAPFDQVPGREVVIIAAVPVLNAPIVMNTGLLSQKEVEAARAALLADSTTANEKIFPPKGSGFKSFFTAGHRFLPVEDKWYDPIRVLAGMQ
jgi:phosphonate transport system substrate-binding protein